MIDKKTTRQSDRQTDRERDKHPYRKKTEKEKNRHADKQIGKKYMSPSFRWQGDTIYLTEVNLFRDHLKLSESVYNRDEQPRQSDAVVLFVNIFLFNQFPLLFYAKQLIVFPIATSRTTLNLRIDTRGRFKERLWKTIKQTVLLFSWEHGGRYIRVKKVWGKILLLLLYDKD